MNDLRTLKLSTHEVRCCSTCARSSYVRGNAAAPKIVARTLPFVELPSRLGRRFRAVSTGRRLVDGRRRRLPAARRVDADASTDTTCAERTWSPYAACRWSNSRRSGSSSSCSRPASDTRSTLAGFRRSSRSQARGHQGRWCNAVAASKRHRWPPSPSSSSQSTHRMHTRHVTFVKCCCNFSALLFIAFIQTLFHRHR